MGAGAGAAGTSRRAICTTVPARLGSCAHCMLQASLLHLLGRKRYSLGWEPGLELLVRPAVLSALSYLRALGRALTACCRLRCSTCLDSSAGRCTGVPANRWHGQQVPRFTSAPAVLV